MKVLQVYKDYYPPINGGIEQHINLLAHTLSHEGIQVEVLVCNRRNKTEVFNDGPIRVTKVADLGRVLSSPVSPAFPGVLNRMRHNFDIIHFHFPNPMAEISSLFGIRGQQNAVVSYHSDIVRQKFLKPLYHGFMFKFLQRAQVILPTSDNYIQFSPVLKRFQQKCRVVPLGIDLNQFVYKPEETQEIENIRARYEKPIILFIGKLRYYKGLPYLIEAMNKTDAVLVILGDGYLEKELKDQVLQSDLNSKIFFAGKVSESEKVKYLHACTMLVLPSISPSEAFGIVQIEAQACKKPIIATELGTGTSYVTKHEETGLIVPPRDTDALTNAMQQLINNPATAKLYGENGYLRAHQLFSKEQMVKSLIQVYQSVIDNN
ncbi:glycosyltransferase [Candidatus Margulisiibacteriota bacterium]